VVFRVAARFLEHGVAGLMDGRVDNGTTKADDVFEYHVLIAVFRSPQDYGFRRPTWTLELLALSVASETGVRVSCSTMSRLLHRQGARRGRPKPIVECPWSKTKKTRRLNHIRRLIDNLPRGEVALYVDEVDIHLNPKIGDDWMLSGQQKEVLTPGKNVKRYLAGALNPHTGHLVWVEGDRKTGHLFLLLLRELLRRYRGARRIHIVLDNYKIHSAKYVQAALRQWGARITLHFLPPYCPDHNRIERLWKDLHDNVTRNHRCANIDDLLREVRHYLAIRQHTHRHQYAQAA
jgi:transposase